MKPHYLKSAKQLLQNDTDFPFRDFNSGIIWMNSQLHNVPLTPHNYSLHGFIKYGISSLVAFLWIYISLTFFPYLAPFAILIFYFVEVHFLFLFPLLLQNKKPYLLQSIQMVYSIGILKCMFHTLFIGLYMIMGLFNFKSPYKNWHIGCLSIVIWYRDEI